MMNILTWNTLNSAGQRAALQRPEIDSSSIVHDVASIIAQVREKGDSAIRSFSLQFDGVELDELLISQEVANSAAAQVEADLLEAMDAAASRIAAFHAAGMPSPTRLETASGLVCESRYLPISPVGLYVPGGSAPLLSTVMMLAIPAVLAGCRKIILCTPPSANGSVSPIILAAARRCGIGEIFAIGGAQAIAAMAFGTETVPRCAKLFGPGNRWVTEAKRQVSSTPEGAAQDMPAGPSEVMVIADASADPVALCWDLLSQAEHGPDSQAILISDCEKTLQAVAANLPVLAASLPRSEILSTSLQSLRLIKVLNLDEALEISNRYAPEHLILNCRHPGQKAEFITTAGSVFLGPWTPESLGDYCSGTNHVLPTYGYARAYSGLSVTDFMRRMTLQAATKQGLQIAGPVAARLAAAEGLDAHRMAVEYRLASMEKT